MEDQLIDFDELGADPNLELILNVSIYHPYNGKKVQEFVVLGSQYLTELKDQIYCICDQLDSKKIFWFDFKMKTIHQHSFLLMELFITI